MSSTLYSAIPLLAILLLLVAALATPGMFSQTPSSSRLIVNPVPVHKDFIRGVDLSEVPWILELGGKYYDENGVERDILDILAESGVNWIRLRVWNDPYDENGNPYGGGNCDLKRMASFAAKAKAKGFKVLIDFHYSDWWADPSKQEKPKAWRNLTFPELVEAVYNWTRSALEYMKNLGALPDMVQVGNEINNGFLWPEGRAENWTQFTTLLKSAIKAVRDVDPSIQVMIHLSGHREVDYYVNYFKRLVESGVEFDVIGLSYYTYWHGDLNKLKAIAKALVENFNKTIVLAEVAYAWTLEDADGHPNLFSSKDMEVKGGYKASVQGQASLIRDIIAALYEAAGEKAGGVFYWGAGWIPYPGAGWKTGEGNPWENQALFDFTGRALPSLKVFRLIYEATPVEVVPLELYDPRPLNITSYVGAKPILPSTVLVVYTDHSIRPTRVDWGEVPVYTQPGTYTVIGYVAGTSIQVKAVITVKEKLQITIQDPEGDDKGPGTYGYPTAAVYKPGVFDITRAEISVEDTYFVVRVYFKNLGGNPWNGPNNFSLQYIHVYMRTTNPAATGRIYRSDTFGMNFKLREDYAWQYALLISPGWGTRPLPEGELSALYYSTGSVYVEDKDFTVLANPSENYVEARIPLSLLSDWENLKYWKVVVAVASWAGENPDRIRSFAPGGGEWLVDPVAYADEQARVKVLAGLMSNTIPKAMDIAVYSEDYPGGISSEEQYKWLMGFNPDKGLVATVPPEVAPQVTATITVTQALVQVQTVTRAVTETQTVTEVQTTTETITQAYYGLEKSIAFALIAAAVGVLAGYFIAVKKAK